MALFFQNYKTILLDYQYTLVENSKDLGFPPKPNTVIKEQFRPHLVEWLKQYPGEIVLVTVRWPDLKDVTLRHLENREPELYKKMAMTLFNNVRKSAPESKLWNFKKHIEPNWGSPHGQYLAIESNEHTRKMYKDIGILAMRQDDPALEGHLVRKGD